MFSFFYLNKFLKRYRLLLRNKKYLNMKNKIFIKKREKAILVRKKFFNFFNDHYVKFPSNNLSKPYINELSPGCKTCINGTWSCIHINFLCTQDCFFCPQDRKKAPISDNHIFNSAEEYVNYLKKFNFEGIGFSGGEPFLVFDKVIEYIRRIREVFGPKHYIWIYTNGDLVTKERLELLRKAGLDELRFNISARNYDLKPVELAIKYINTVTIEIPAIPEDLNLLKSLLKKIESIGVKYLNIHQLYATKYNCDLLRKKNYTFLKMNNYNIPSVLESELAAFGLLRYAIKTKTKIGINYCSSCYKNRFQSQAFRKRYIPSYSSKLDSITQTGYIRRLFIKGTKNELNLLINNFNKNKNLKYRLAYKDKKYNYLILPILFLSKILESEDIKKSIHINYYSIGLKTLDDNSFKNNKIGKKIFKKIDVAQIELKNIASIIFFQKLFIENKSFKQIIEELSEKYNLDENEKSGFLEDIKSFYKKFADLEYLLKDLPDYNIK
jgi:pyruvate formate-lyase activating enzyme-like uncharacterized protein